MSKSVCLSILESRRVDVHWELDLPMGNNRKKGLVSDAYRVFTLPFRVPLFLGRARSDLDSKVNKKATGT